MKRILALLALVSLLPVAQPGRAEATGSPQEELASIARMAGSLEAGIDLESGVLSAAVERLRELDPVVKSVVDPLTIRVYLRCVDRLAECSGRIEKRLEECDLDAAAGICGAELLPLCFDTAVCLAALSEPSRDRG